MFRFSIRQLVVFITLCAIYFAATARGWLRPLVALHFAVAMVTPVVVSWAVRQRRLELHNALAIIVVVTLTLCFELYTYEMFGSLIVLVVVALAILPLYRFGLPR